MAEFREQQRKQDAQFDAFQAEMRAKEGLPPKENEKQRASVVFRLDSDLLARVHSTAERTGRNDRQVVEFCLEFGVPLAGVWILLDPAFDQLKGDWEQLRKLLSEGGTSMSYEEWQTSIRETTFVITTCLLEHLSGIAMTKQQKDALRAKIVGKPTSATAESKADVPPTAATKAKAQKPVKKKPGK